MRQIAFLRGINVGGRHKVPMAELRACLGALPLANVRTYIQSGNVAYDTDLSVRDAEARLAAAIEATFGFAVPVVVRTAAELTAIVAANPFAAEAEPKTLHVGFCIAPPTRDTLDRDRSPPDQFAVVGAQVYLHCPKGMARTKLTTPWFERGLGVPTITVRNWRTVNKMLAMATD